MIKDTTPPVRWVEELPGRRPSGPRDSHLDAAAAALIGNPGHWALVQVSIEQHQQKLAGRGTALRRRSTEALLIETVTRRVDGMCHLYGRAVER